MSDAEVERILLETVRGLVKIKPKATGNDVAAACWHIVTTMVEDGQSVDALDFLRTANRLMATQVVLQLLARSRPRWRA